MKKLTLLMLFFSVLSFSQKITLDGKITTKNNEIIAFANIELQNTTSKITKGTISDKNGVFKFDEIAKGSYALKISYLGFKTVIQQLNLIESKTLMPIILVEDAATLDEVNITFKKPTITQKAGKHIFNIKNTILANQDSWKILNNTPSVFMSGDNVMVKSNQADIYVNDKKINVQDKKSFLESLDGNAIQSIEVIANPSAKYDAESNSIINIVLKKRFKDRYKANVNANYIIGKKNSYNVGTTHFYKKGKIDITAIYNYSNSNKLIIEDEEINYFDNAILLTSNWQNTSDYLFEDQKHNLLFNIDYTLNKRNTLSLSTIHNFLVNSKNSNKAAGFVFDENAILTSIYKADNNAIQNNKFLSYGLDFTHKLKKQGEKINVEINYNYFNNDQTQNANTDYFFADESFNRNNKFKVKTDQKINIAEAKMDYSLPISSATSYKAGIKFSTVESKNDFNQFDFLADEPILDQTKSNLFTYNESNFALYNIYSNQGAKFYYELGLRGEFTNLDGNSKTILGNEKNEDNYFKIFPNITLDYYPDKNQDFILQYKKSINRPNYNQLNPFRFFISDFSANVGNPKLKPTIIRALDFIYIYKGNYRFNIFYSKQKDRVSKITYQDNATNIIDDTSVNLKNYFSYGFLFSATTKITKRWSLFSQIFLVDRNYDFIAINTDNEVINKTKFNYNLKFVNNFTFLKDKSLKASLSYAYVAPDNQNGATVINRFLKTDFSLQKTFFKNKAVLTLGLEDIFDTGNGISITKYSNQDMKHVTDTDFSLFKIGFKYKFGNTKLRENNRKKTNKEIKRLDN